MTTTTGPTTIEDLESSFEVLVFALAIGRSTDFGRAFIATRSS